MIETVLRILNSGQVLNALNHTYIAMIPKKKQVVNVGNFHPISLYNVVYKLVSKVIVNCLKLVLLHVISPSQSTFMLGRQITDNIIVAYELVHYLRRK